LCHFAPDFAKILQDAIAFFAKHGDQSDLQVGKLLHLTWMDRTETVETCNCAGDPLCVGT
jgi:hypothetical protein